MDSTLHAAGRHLSQTTRLTPPRAREQTAGRELYSGCAAEAALRAIAKQTMDSISKPPPLGLGLDITLTVKELYGIDPETILRSFD